MGPFQMVTRRRFVGTTAALPAAAALNRHAHAFSGRPVTLIVPFAPGGGTDILAREFATVVPRYLGTQIFVENRAGASGTLGTQHVANAAPDGQTLLFSSAVSTAILPHLYTRMPRLNLTAVSAPAYSPYVICSSSLRSVSDMRGRTPRFANPGVGTVPHIMALLIAQQGRFPVLHVPFRGTAPALAELISGQQVDAMCMPLIVAEPHVRAGRLNTLAISAPVRPGVPSFEDVGLGGAAFSDWLGVMAPQGTRPDIVDTLNRAFGAAAQDPQLRNRVTAAGYFTEVATSAQTDRLIQGLADRLGEAIRRAGLTMG